MSDKNIACKDMILELQDMTYLDWAAEKTMSGTPGCFVKIYEEAKGKRVYYKLSNYDCERGIFGRECVNELIASRLMNVLGIPHADYKLIHAKVRIGGKEQETWLSVSEDFLMPNQEKMPYEDYYNLQKEGNETPLEFAIRNGWGLSIYQMFSIYGNEMLLEKADVMKDFPANNYIGERSLEHNLSLIPQNYDLKINPLREEDRMYIFDHIEEALSEKHIHKLWEMMWKRWCHFEQIRNKKNKWE